MELEYFSAVAADDLNTVQKILKSCSFKPDIIMSRDINQAINYDEFQIFEYGNIYKNYFRIGGNTAIHVACRFGSLNVLEYLWDLNIDLGNHKHLLEIALQNRRLVIICFLLNKGGFSLKGSYMLRKSVEYGFVDIAKFFIDECNIDINKSSKYDEPILCLASSPNNIDMFILLLESGANVNNFNNEEYTETPLNSCIYYENIEGIKQLIRFGLDVNAKCGNHVNGIFAAVYIRKMIILELLLANCCPNLEMVDENGNTILHNMVRIEGDYEKHVVRLLLKYGAKLETVLEILESNQRCKNLL